MGVREFTYQNYPEISNSFIYILGWGSSTSVATPSSTGADVQSPASSIKSEDYMQQPSTASPATPLLLNSPQSLGLTANTISGTQSFCITSYPGHEILSTNEKRLCTNLKLTPAHYIRFINDMNDRRKFISTPAEKVAYKIAVIATGETF